MTTPQQAKLAPCLWFADDAEEAAGFYVSLLPDSRIDRILRAPADYPGGKAGNVLVVEFTVAGQPFSGINGGTRLPASNAVSFTIGCDDQAEVDRLWDALAQGGTPQACGWLQDRFGVVWQIIPRALQAMLSSEDAQAKSRAFNAMMDMVKLDIAALQAAFDGKA
jgi:predicted 3-demethylubiquinone-9 3-methyltransferase (glyoxalase superfamily)